eukprot:scaffold95715_cov33-Tisochrysis_lutea.AAC.1
MERLPYARPTVCAPTRLSLLEPINAILASGSARHHATLSPAPWEVAVCMRIVLASDFGSLKLPVGGGVSHTGPRQCTSLMPPPAAKGRAVVPGHTSTERKIESCLSRPGGFPYVHRSM